MQMWKLCALEHGAGVLDVLRGLPDALHVHVQHLEEQLAVEAQGPEDGLVVLFALEHVLGVLEDDVVPIDVICTETARKKAQPPVRAPFAYLR